MGTAPSERGHCSALQTFPATLAWPRPGLYLDPLIFRKRSQEKGDLGLFSHPNPQSHRTVGVTTATASHCPSENCQPPSPSVYGPGWGGKSNKPHNTDLLLWCSMAQPQEERGTQGHQSPLSQQPGAVPVLDPALTVGWEKRNPKERPFGARISLSFGSFGSASACWQRSCCCCQMVMSET